MMFNLEQCYAKINNLDFVKKHFGNELVENEKIIEKENGKITFKNEKVKEFYQKYESELNSFKREKLHKIYDDLKLRVELIINTLDNTHKVMITSTKVEYIDYQNKENNCCIESSEALLIKRKFNQVLDEKEKVSSKDLVRDYAVDMADISFVFNANILDKDEFGIYFINNNKNKEYIFFFGKEKDLWTFLVG